MQKNDIKKTQIVFAPNVEYYEKIGVNWHAAFFDIVEYLNSLGFKYSKQLMFVIDRVLSEEEMNQVAVKICELGLGVEGFLSLGCNYLGDTQSLSLDGNYLDDTQSLSKDD